MKSEGLLFILGNNITVHHAKTALANGEIEYLTHVDVKKNVRQIRGMFIPTGLSPNAKAKLIQQNAVRIFHRIHGDNSNIMLAGPSAVHRDAINRVIYVASTAGRYTTKSVGGCVTINYSNMQNAGVLFRPEKMWLDDVFGRCQVYVMPDPYVFLQSFQETRSGGRLSIADQCYLLDRMIAKSGGIPQVWSMLQATDKTLGAGPAVLERVRNFIKDRHRYQDVIIPDVRLDLRLGSVRLGQIHGTRQEWTFHRETTVPLFAFMRHNALVRGNAMPVFVECLLPERLVNIEDDERNRLYTLMTEDARYLSNIRVHSAHSLPQLVRDEILPGAELARHCEDHIFKGTLCLHAPPSERPLKARLVAMGRAEGMPYIPGMQDKAACSLDADGNLFFAKDRPFTHILKFPGGQDQVVTGASEWVSMQLFKAAGIVTNDFALVHIDSIGPCYLAERFDIPHPSDKEARIKVFEDFCSVTNTPMHKRYGHLDLVAIADRLAAESSNPRVDGERLFRRVVGSYILGDMDAHARNFGVVSSMPVSRLGLRHAAFAEDPASFEGVTIRLSPAFDVLCTVGLEGLSSMPALPMAKAKYYNRESFMRFAQACLLEPECAQRIMNTMHRAMEAKLAEIRSAPPASFDSVPEIAGHLEKMAGRIDRSRLDVVDENLLDSPVTSDVAQGDGIHSARRKMNSF